MAQLAWEKAKNNAPEKGKQSPKERMKFLVGGALILVAVGILIFSGTVTGARFFITVDEVVTNNTYVGQSVRLTGVVLGDTIDYDPQSGSLNFTIAHIPREFEDLALTLHESANNPSATRLQIVMADTTMPDLLQHEAQAILTGTLEADGKFHATELNLKCPTRFEEHSPDMLGTSS